MPTPVRYFDLTAAVDADPLTQPAATAYGDLVTGFGGAIQFAAWLVDADGVVQPAGSLTVDLAVAWVSRIEVERVPPSAAPSVQMAWSRGPIATTKAPGIGLIQAELAEVVGFTVVVLAKSASPAGMRLAIQAMRGPRS